MVSKSDRENDKFVKYVVKLGYTITGETDIVPCTECGKSRLCQQYEAPEPARGQADVYLCEQCTWGISDEYFREYYPDQYPEARPAQYTTVMDENDDHFCELAYRHCSDWDCLTCPVYLEAVANHDIPTKPVSFPATLPKHLSRKPRKPNIKSRIQFAIFKIRILVRQGPAEYLRLKHEAEAITKLHEALALDIITTRFDLSVKIRQQWSEKNV